MKLLEQVKQITGVDNALGLRFSRGNLYAPMLPTGGRMIGYTESAFFCFVDGYQDTVFAVLPKADYGTVLFPLAYDFREFLRLVLACGSAGTAAKAGVCGRDQFAQLLDTQHRAVSLDILQVRFNLHPVEDPYAYVQTIRSVIDCSPIRC